MINLEHLDPLTGRVFTALGRTIHLHKRLMTRELAKKGSHPVEAFCLRLLSLHDGLSQRDLAERLHVSRPGITRVLQVLEKAGAVSRRADEHDQRLVRVFLTDRGREVEVELRSVWDRYLAETIGTLTDQEKLELERLLSKMNTALVREVGDEAVCGDPAPRGDPACGSAARPAEADAAAAAGAAGGEEAAT